MENLTAEIGQMKIPRSAKVKAMKEYIIVW